MDPALSKTLLLALPSMLGVVLLVVHGFVFRRARLMLGFVLGAFLFGILRGNVIRWITIDWVRMQGAEALGLMPYIITTPVLRIGHASLQESVGWVFALYLGWCMSERILARLGLERRLFGVAGLTFVFMACICYAVEAGAGALGWWVWTLPLKSRYFLDVPGAGMWAWPSVAFDFFLPFLLIATARPVLGRWRWAALLLFPLHMALHTWNIVYKMRGGEHPAMFYHLGMLVSVLGLTCTARLEAVFILPAPRARLAPVARWFPMGVAVMLLTVLAAGMGAVAGRPELLVTVAPLAVFVLLAAPRVPWWVAAAAAAACSPLAEWRGLAAWAPLAAFGLVAAGRRWGADWRFRLALAAALAALAVGMVAEGTYAARLVREYVNVRLNMPSRPDTAMEAKLERSFRAHPRPTEFRIMAGVLFNANGRLDLAAEEYRRATELEPEHVWARSQLGIVLAQMERFEEAVRELRRAVEIVPGSPDLHLNLAMGYLLRGDLEAGKRALLRAIELAPQEAYACALLARTYIAQGDHARARAAVETGLALKPRDQNVQAELSQLRDMLNRASRDAAGRAGQAVP